VLAASETRAAEHPEERNFADISRDSPPAAAPLVLLVCCGLDHARRGFESFARECFDALRADPGIRIELVKGSGDSGPGERAIPTLRRDRRPALALSRIFGVRAFRFEALAFAFSLQPLLWRRKPDVVYLSEWDTARGLALLRKITRQRFKLVLSNGTFAPAGFEHLDRVQELTPANRDWLVDRGADPRRHTVLPLGFQIECELRLPTPMARSALRERLGLPRDRTIVISVAALNRSHKRLDYLIEELAALPEPRPFLLLVGEPDEETAEIRSLANHALGERGHSIRTVPAEEVPDLYRASDVFVLASLAEAQGRALIEAMSYGLPCVAHDSPVMRFAAGDHGLFGDLSQRGSLTRLLRHPPESGAAQAQARHRHVYERFSWESLRPRYVEFLAELAQPRP
jgi:1,2-diacylglycerol 3-alpha-glucosyltransferase